MNFLSLWIFFKSYLTESSFGLWAVLSLFSVVQPVSTRTTGDMLMRVSNAISRSLVVSFFTQRHPQAKSNTTERKDGLIEGRKSTNRWDFEELTDAIFQCNFKNVCLVWDTQEDESQWKVARIIWSCINSSPDKYGYTLLGYLCYTRKHFYNPSI